MKKTNKKEGASQAVPEMTNLDNLVEFEESYQQAIKSQDSIIENQHKLITALESSNNAKDLEQLIVEMKKTTEGAKHQKVLFCDKATALNRIIEKCKKDKAFEELLDDIFFVFNIKR